MIKEFETTASFESIRWLSPSLPATFPEIWAGHMQVLFDLTETNVKFCYDAFSDGAATMGQVLTCRSLAEAYEIQRCYGERTVQHCFQYVQELGKTYGRGALTGL